MSDFLDFKDCAARCERVAKDHAANLFDASDDGCTHECPVDCDEEVQLSIASGDDAADDLVRELEKVTGDVKESLAVAAINFAIDSFIIDMHDKTGEEEREDEEYVALIERLEWHRLRLRSSRLCDLRVQEVQP